MLTKPLEIGGITTSVDRQKFLAMQSRSFVCPICKLGHQSLLNGGSGLGGRVSIGKAGSSISERGSSELTEDREGRVISRAAIKKLKKSVRSQKAARLRRKQKSVQNIARTIIALISILAMIAMRTFLFASNGSGAEMIL
jgi:hypothetical protein